jgi:molybdopterin/thiamine biosynthesis adenylyltransferase/rhodanese-related sulfurtransferase
MKIEELEKADINKICLLDMRDPVSYHYGYIPGAILFDAENIEKEVRGLPKDKPCVVYCTYGKNSISVAEQLREYGFDAHSLEGGYSAWLKQEMKDYERYDRQMILPEVGSAGQRKLKNSKILIVGAGGLGAPTAQYLAGAGVGTIGIMDADDVNISNLHRQVIHITQNIGKNKAESAKEGMLRINDGIEVISYTYYLSPENAEDIISKYDFVLDCVDNFETKFLINDVCVLLKKPFCHAGVLRFQGQVKTYVPDRGPCYRCIFEEVPEDGSIPNCSQAGIIGAVAGIIGCVQALEAIKYILGSGELLTNKMFVLDGLTMRSRLVPFSNPSAACRVCGPHADITNIALLKKECTHRQCGSC